MRTRTLLVAGTFVLQATLAAFLTPSGASAQNTLQESGLIGKLEGVKISDRSKWPTKFHEAPELAELVKQGKLPPVEQRLPEDLMVIQPVHEIGKYGGIWHRGFTGPGDNENGNRIQASDRPILVDETGSVPRPSLGKGWKMSDDGKTYTLYLRKGLKWSDGAPFTADDFVFWFEDIYSNKDIVPTPIADMTPEGKPGRIVKVDDYTVNFEFDVPFYLFEELMVGDTLIGGGQAVRQSEKRSYGAYAPAHYLKQYLPKYAGGVDKANAAAKAAGYDNWVAYLHFKKDWTLNPELPVLGPWHTVKPINNPTWVMERNPYYWAVDTEGNQLPYIDGIVMTLAEDLEVLNLRAIAGEYDLQERHVDLGKLPVILDNQEKGNYKVHLDVAFNGADAVYQFNQTYDADPEIAKWLTNADFRRALSLAIDRDQLNQTFWLGVGTPGSPVPGESLPYFPGPGWREKWSTYDPAKANQMLDAIGLGKKDAEGFRLRTDNGERLRLEIQAVQAFLPGPRSARWSPTNGGRSGSRPTSRTPSARSRSRAPRPTSTRSWSGPTAAPSFSTCSRAMPSRSTRPRRSWGRSSPSGTSRVALRAASPTIRTCSRFSSCSVALPARRASSGSRPPRRSGRSWPTSSTALARSASRRRSWGCVWFPTSSATSRTATASRSTAGRRAERIPRPGITRSKHTPTLTLPCKGGGKDAGGSMGSPSPFMGEGRGGGKARQSLRTIRQADPP